MIVFGDYCLEFILTHEVTKYADPSIELCAVRQADIRRWLTRLRR
jgi:hypothetical protein